MRNKRIKKGMEFKIEERKLMGIKGLINKRFKNKEEKMEL